METMLIGLVLKRFFPYKQKVCVLTKKNGKINLVSTDQRLIEKLWPGMIIEYEPKQNNLNIKVTNNINILLSITNIEKHDIKWLHSLLEISYYSLPLNYTCNESFKLLCHSILILTRAKIFREQFNILKKIYFLKLLHILGLISETESLSIEKYIISLSSIFVDFSDKQKVESVKVMLKNINKAIYREIDFCIMKSIKKHPFYNNFKSNYFTIKS